jgi:hypothetical protein
MSTKQSTEDLDVMLAQFEEGLQGLKSLLKSQSVDSQSTLHKVPPARNLEDGTAETESPRKGLGSSVNSMETEAIIQRIETVHWETKISERLARVERQARRLSVIGAMCLTILSVGFLALAFLTIQTRLSHQPPLLRDGKVADRAVSSPPSSLKVKDGDLAPEIKSDKPDGGPSLGSKENPRYVGSTTSNKYHSPDCKLAKTIIPERLIGFNSVAEAEEEGYIRCQTCKPPRKD